MSAWVEPATIMLVGPYTAVGLAGERHVGVRAGSPGLRDLTSLFGPPGRELLTDLARAPRPIPRIVEHVDVGGGHWAASELRVGPTLETIIAAPGQLPVELAARIAGDVARAAAWLGTRTSVFAIDPGVVLIDLSGQTTVLAAAHLPVLSDAVAMAMPVVPLRWMPPEQIRVAVGERSAAWVAAIVAHDLTAGAPLFAGESMLVSARRILGGQIEPKEVPEPIRSLVREGLAAEHDARPPVDEVLARLDKIAEGADNADLARLIEGLFPDDARESRACLEELALLA